MSGKAQQLGFFAEARTVPVAIAMEIAHVGIVPLVGARPIGHVLNLAGQAFTIIAEVTADEFYATAESKGLKFSNKAPLGLHFYKIATD